MPDNSVDVTFADSPFNLKKGYNSYKDLQQFYHIPTKIADIDKIKIQLKSKIAIGVPLRSTYNATTEHQQTEKSTLFEAKVDYCSPTEQSASTNNTP